jgi:hypothetical protein
MGASFSLIQINFAICNTEGQGYNTPLTFQFNGAAFIDERL